MKYTEVGFRAVYKKFCVFLLSDELKAGVKEYPGADDANCVLTYGYIDRDAGVTLEVVALGVGAEDKYCFFDTNADVRMHIRIGAVENEEFSRLEDEGDLKERYSEKLALLKAYDAEDEVERSREMRILDASRNVDYPDDVMVYLTREGLEPEGCWTRIFGLGKSWIIGTLLNEPNQPFGYHIGEAIGFFPIKTETGKDVCVTDMTPSKRITAEDLADGSMLKGAVSAYYRDPNEDNFFEIIETLRDSTVLVPYSMVLMKGDMEKLQQTLSVYDGELSSLIGQKFQNSEDILMIPDFLESEGEEYFPTFSSGEEIPENDESAAILSMHFLEVVEVAAKANGGVGINVVLNPFTDPFVLDKKIFDIVKNLKSRIE